MPFFGFGTLLKVGDGASPEVFTSVAEVIGPITGPGIGVDSVEVTDTESPNTHREYIPGLVDAGEISFDMNFLPQDSTQDETNGLISLAQARTTKNFQIVYSDTSNSTWAITGFITSLEPTAPIDDRATMSCTIKITGKPVLS